jgi:hypothetical protein
LTGAWLAFGLMTYVWGWAVTQLHPTDAIWQLDEPVSSLSVYWRALSPNGIGWDPILRPWFRWDTVWYLRIAMDGYAVFDGRQAFAPLYPMTVRLVGSAIGGNMMMAALIVSGTSLLIAVHLLFQLVRSKYKQGAMLSVLFLLTFPTSFFLWGGYSEALFLALSLAAFYMSENNRWAGAGIFAALSVLTRFQGVFIILPLAWIMWRNYAGFNRKMLWLLFVPLAFAGFVAYVRLGTVGRFPWDELANNWNKHWAMPWTGIVNNIRVLYRGNIAWTDSLPFLLDLICALGVSVLGVGIYLKGDKTYALWCFCLLLPAICSVSETGTLISVSRYVLTIFPMFVFLALSVPKHTRAISLAIGVCLQFILSMLFFEWVWIA